MLKSIFFIVIGFLFLIGTYTKVSKKLFSEKESFFWLLGSVFIILSPFTIKYVDVLSRYIGIDYPPSLVFSIMLLFAYYLIFRLTQNLSIQNDKIKELGQLLALLEKKTDDKINLQHLLNSSEIGE